VLAFEVYSPTRSDLRRFLKNLAANEGFPAHPIEVATAKALVLRAAQAQTTERSAPKRWVEWRSRLGTTAEVRLPGALVQDALGSRADAAGLEVAAQLVATGRIGPWPPLRVVLTPVVERIQSALASPLVVSGATRREQVGRLIEEAAAEIFSGATAAVAGHRMREAAFGFWRAADEASAVACLAAAAAFEGEPTGENPVARAFVERWLRPLLSAGDETAPAPSAEAAEGSLLVRP
jgi:hypothetical protein